VAAIAIGLLSSVFCYYAVSHLKNALKYDDTLDAFGLHGFGGIWGAIATGLFASTKVNDGGADGLLYGGGFHLLWTQCIAVGATVAFAGVATFILIKLVNIILPIRVEEEHEEKGLDESLHGEKAYS